MRTRNFISILTASLLAGFVTDGFAQTKTETKTKTETTTPAKSGTETKKTETTTTKTETKPKAEAKTETKTETKTTTTTTETKTETVMPSEFNFKGVGDFFNVREANSNVKCGQWAGEVTWFWETDSSGTDDDTGVAAAVYYGVNDDIFVELGIMPLNLGDGDEQGNGDLRAVAFWQFLHESDCSPAAAVWAAMRIPSGEGSSDIDVDLHGNVTKTVAPKCRVHLEGWVKSSNGGRGQYDVDRRYFHWGVGPGADYEIDPCNLFVLNYLNRNSEFFGHHNLNVLELGLVHKFNECSALNVGVDIGLDGADETPNFLVKAQYAFNWK